ncbi:TonB-dependent receptor domain-containing protein [Chitinophaga nivalis]|uniref:TonB-dependent receptor n=1 Tax=Chitinophaga nivalis TaxID=2991709 RepID=A0ABT3ITI2_9BACT|nr:TonB-dependent receptor [Chitinophaga nivalis]MCW3463008.1 TonB-dependent receptor [Chitinophaga nivalis]MCW3487302.1 TonB-dependent receptor [Chitinophaga nivalis]
MKITVLLLTCFLLHVHAHTFAQRISMNRQHSTIHAVLEDIRKQAKYDFFYDMDLFNRAKPVSIQVREATVEQVLNIIFKGQPYSYTIDNKMVVITKADAAVNTAPQVIRQQSGRIGGKVLDDRGGALPGASVKIVQSNQAVQSGIDGSYSFSIAPGSYTVEVSYISFQTRRITQVAVKAGQLTSLNIVLVPSTRTLGQVVVTGSYKKESVAGLYAAQKNAASVTDGISAEQISRTPDNDMGQVLKRVTGLTTVNNRSVVVRGMSDRYNQAMLDGVVIPSTSQNRRDFSFDIIPTEMVSTVVVNKTATPDVSAEFSGGQVSVNTIDIPEKNFTTIQYGIGGNAQAIGKDFYRLGKRQTSEYFGFFDKSSKMPDGIKTWQWNNRSSQLDAPPGYNLTDPELNGTPLNPMESGDAVKYNDLDAIAQSKRLNSDAMRQYRYKVSPNQNMRFSIGRTYDLKNNKRFGFAAAANFRNEQNIVTFNNVRGSIKGGYLDSTGLGDNGAGTSYRFNSSGGLVANMGLQGNGFKIALKNMYARTYSDNYNESIQKAHDDSNPIASKLVYQLPEAMSLQQHQLIGSYQLPWKIKAEGMFTINKIRQEILDERKLSYRLTAIIGDKPYFQTPGLMTHSNASVKAALNDWRMWTRINETDYNWSAAFSRKFGEEKSVSTLVKFGYQAWSKKRSLDLYKMAPWTRSWTVGTTNQLAPPIEINYDQLLSSENIGNGNGQAYYYADALGGRFYNGEMSSHALYLMADQKLWNNLRLVYGVRAEYFGLNSKQEEVYKRRYNKEPDPNDQLRHMFGVKENNWRFLPSINVTYSLTPQFNIRGSYSKTVIRPDFREVGMFGMYDFELDGYVYGEHVQSTLIDNIDMRLEWYPSPGEIISITGYYKKLDNPIELVHSGGSDYTFANMENAKNLGLELEIRKDFTFLSNRDWAKNLFIHANGTLLKSKVNVLSQWQWINNPETQVAERVQTRYPNQDRPLIGQSPWLLNVGLGYWGDYFGATVSYNHRGPRTNLANVNMNRVEYELAPKQLDAQFYARFFKKKVEVKFNLANLLDDWTRYYMNVHDYKSDDTKFYVLEPGKSVKYRKADGDIITYRKKEGRRFSLSVSYNF